MKFVFIFIFISSMVFPMLFCYECCGILLNLHDCAFSHQETTSLRPLIVRDAIFEIDSGLDEHLAGSKELAVRYPWQRSFFLFILLRKCLL